RPSRKMAAKNGKWRCMRSPEYYVKGVDMTHSAGRPTIDAAMPPTIPAVSSYCIRVLSTVPVGPISEAAELHGEIPISCGHVRGEPPFQPGVPCMTHSMR